MNFNFKFYGNVRFGSGCRFDIKEIIDSNDINQIVVVIDENVRNNDATKDILRIINKYVIKEIVFDASKPTYEKLDEKRFDSIEHNIDAILAIGGGSTIDLAKGLSVLYTNNAPAISYRGFNKFKTPILPIIAVPTTAGTGSEITPNASFIDTKEKRKMGINGEAIRPKYAILDPELTLSCPRTPTISAGMDSMVHATEAFVAKKSNPIARMFSKKGFSLVLEFLPLLIYDLHNIELREKVMYGAFLSAIALMNSGSGPAAAMSYPLEVHFGIPHGMGGGVFLPQVIKYNMENGFVGYEELLERRVGKSSVQGGNSESFLETIDRVWDKLEMPRSIRPFGVDENNLNLVVDDTMELEAALQQNPLPFERKTIHGIMERLLISQT